MGWADVESKKLILASILVLSILSTTPQSSAEGASKPAWQKGDVSAMGASDVDINSLVEQYWKNYAQELGRHWKVNQEGKGTLSSYEIWEMGGAKSQPYEVLVDRGSIIKMSSDYTLFYGPENMGNGTLDSTTRIKMSGSLYFDQDNYSLSSQDLEGKLSTEMHEKYSILTNPTLDLYRKYEFDGASDLDFTAEITYNPPLDVFDFPVTKGENWTAESTIDITASVEGKVEIDDEEIPVSYSYENSGDVSIFFECTGTKNLVLEDGSQVSAYKIEHAGGTSMSAPFYGSRGVAYYSPSSGFIVRRDQLLNSTALDLQMFEESQAISKTTQSIMSENFQTLYPMNPASEEGARDFISQMESGGGWRIVTIGIGVVIVAVVIGLILLAMRTKGGGREEEEYWGR